MGSVYFQYTTHTQHTLSAFTELYYDKNALMINEFVSRILRYVIFDWIKSVHKNKKTGRNANMMKYTQMPSIKWKSQKPQRFL